MPEETQKIFTVNLPDIGEGVVEGEVIEWLKQLNDPLKQDEPVVVVMTDKATVELPAPYPGKLLKQHYRAGEIAIKDQPLYDIALEEEVKRPIETKTENKEISEDAPLALPSAPNKEKPPIAPKTSPSTALSPLSSKALASPSTRKLAQELSLDINRVPPSGENAIVLRQDVIKFHGHAIGSSAEEDLSSAASLNLKRLLNESDEEVPLIGIRNLMAKRMAESKRLIPHFSYFEQIDATHLIQLRQTFKEIALKDQISFSITYMPFLIKALSLSLKQYPYINSSIDMKENKILLHKQHHIGIAISTEKGLIVPVLKNVQEMKLVEVIQKFEELKKRALEGKLLSSDMKDATITISNFGVLGGEGLWATPIINSPEVAILAVSKIHKEAVVKNSLVVVRDVLNLSWSFDHRVIDGDLAASFSHYFGMLVQNPAPLT